MKSMDDDRIGVMFRYRDPTNYYRFRWQNERYGSARMNLEKIVEGKWALLATFGGSYIPGEWHTVKVRAVGDELAVFVDGYEMLNAWDESHSRGRIALYSSANAGACFDNVAVYRGNPPEFDSRTIPLTITKGPYLQNVSTNGITFMWETSKDACSRVHYGETQTYGAHEASEKMTRIHKVAVTGLQPGREYHYRVRSSVSYATGRTESVSSEDSAFKTAIEKQTPFCFAVYGDSRGKSPRHKRIIDGMIARRPEFVLHTGDLINAVDVDAGALSYVQWEEMFFAPATALMKNTPLYIAIGNHELREGAAHWLYRFFDFPRPGGYYSFDYGNAHFVVLNSNAVQGYPVPDFRPGSVQYKWLEEDLGSSTAMWKFVFFHHPPYASTRSAKWKRACEDMKALCPVFESHKVDMVFNGHIHTYERTHALTNNAVDKENGVIYVVTGGGGAGLSSHVIEEGSWWTAKLAHTHNYCIVKLTGGNLEMQVYDIDGKLIDYLTVRKR